MFGKSCLKIINKLKGKGSFKRTWFKKMAYTSSFLLCVNIAKQIYDYTLEKYNRACGFCLQQMIKPNIL